MTMIPREARKDKHPADAGANNSMGLGLSKSTDEGNDEGT
eukprot:CAMPEP_0194111912 /NCGR_PEP_ID=MMETSP0150-20130528/10804_1 /TAXON_ID=122233 /ORGANISM="Chaetoceros debilis, Strain MM31A-1" /LENGTH=39 /DNA_ID= /DNA_START= /DNA_END= /DNA_ORIENTATION=